MALFHEYIYLFCLNSFYYCIYRLGLVGLPSAPTTILCYINFVGGILLTNLTFTIGKGKYPHDDNEMRWDVFK